MTSKFSLEKRGYCYVVSKLQIMVMKKKKRQWLQTFCKYVLFPLPKHAGELCIIALRSELLLVCHLLRLQSETTTQPRRLFPAVQICLRDSNFICSGAISPLLCGIVSSSLSVPSERLQDCVIYIKCCNLRGLYVASCFDIQNQQWSDLWFHL